MDVSRAKAVTPMEAHESVIANAFNCQLHSNVAFKLFSNTLPNWLVKLCCQDDNDKPVIALQSL